MIILKSPEQIVLMRRSGKVLTQTHAKLRELVRPGITTLELDRAAEEYIRSQGAIPSFKGYQGFPGSICVAINDVVVHGIPGSQRLEEGDIIGIDIGTILGGWHADSAQTIPVGEISQEAQNLLATTERALWEGIAQAQPGNKLGDISATIEEVAKKAGYGVVRDLVGHGIGTKMHEDPQVPNFGKRGRGITLRVGMTIAIEPMFNLGTHRVVLDSDNWTVRTADGKLSAHFEHTVAITASGPVPLTTLGEERF
jgi:methionyl aminopeptidase